MTKTQAKHLEADMRTFLGDEHVKVSLSEIRRGIERELIRTNAHDSISRQPHPKALGSALTHPYITTDFAESQLELVTPAMSDRTAMLDALASLHRFVSRGLPQGETMWGASMPPVLPDDAAIEIANYGSSNKGQLKMRYRQGLANRYGKRMQMISGIHYNFSLPTSFWVALHAHVNSEQSLEAFTSDRYFWLIRNILRHGWVIPYLFGASPAVDQSFLAGTSHDLEPLDDDTFYLPWATSLRLSRMGYSSDEQSSFPVSFNNKQDYLLGLYHALTRPSERYTHLPTEQQLNGSVLQLENELYGSVRPKIVSDQLRPLLAMCQQGVQYIELRSLDNNPFLPLGISEQQSRFLDVFLTYCALAPSPVITEQERVLIATRQELVATQGRKPGLQLPTLSGEQSLQALGVDLLSAMEPVADVFDSAVATNAYRHSVVEEQSKFLDSGKTPSAQLIAQMNSQGMSYRDLVMQLSRHHKEQDWANAIAGDELEHLERLATESLFEQAQLEAQQEISFDEFLQQQNRLQCDCEQQEVAV
ncbi:glutamate--cysteine ligase [Photobacterium satsumensis]|uniref:glutamate--cysteine ligase n=1 Tax=Photobacterium satsumensis TaxID=2910239 RepID=UPI003D0B4F6C